MQWGELDGLRIRMWRDESDGTCALEAMARSRGFSGTGSAWFGIAQVAAFAEALAAFPIEGPAKDGIWGGYHEEVKQVHLALSAKQIDSSGHVAVQVRVATPLDGTARPESQQVAQVEILTTYEALGRFARQLRALAAGEIEEAVLLADAG